MSDVSKQLILGVDGGATKTSWVLCEANGETVCVLSEGSLGPGSMKLLDHASLISLLSALPAHADRVGLFLAGCATAEDRASLHTLAAQVWPQAHLSIGSDRDSGYAAALGQKDGISVIAGTGSAVTGRRGKTEVRAGGWGHLLGDTGGGYDLAIHALRRALLDADTGVKSSDLSANILRELGLNTLRDLTNWAQSARKSDLARLTPLLFQHANEPEVYRILEFGASALARLTANVARQLDFSVPVVRLIGSVFVKQPLYRQLFIEQFSRDYPEADVQASEVSGSLGAASIALGSEIVFHAELALAQDESDLLAAPTEQRNPRSHNLHEQSPSELVHLFIKEERHVEDALLRVSPALTQAVEIVAAALGQGGRLFYVGAGTSGRLGLLDASEMPPTFGVEADLVQAILAGGITAFQKAIEGAEDSPGNGAQAIQDRGVRAGDVVCGITASGRTPFVLGALKAAREKGAKTLFLTCNPERPKATRHADVEIDLPTGPELITGSTRLKAGTATKVALNIISSASMIRLGRVDGNLMSCLKPTNEKLRNRAIRIVAAHREVSPAKAKDLLEWSNWNIREAMKRQMA